MRQSNADATAESGVNRWGGELATYEINDRIAGSAVLASAAGSARTGAKVGLDFHAIYLS
jgi:carbamoylphosphate synthase large subunit